MGPDERMAKPGSKPEAKKPGASPTAAVRQDLGEVMLEAAEEALIELATPYHLRRSVRGKAPPWWKSRAVIAGAAGLIVLVAGGVYYKQSHRPPPPPQISPEAVLEARRIDDLLARARGAYVGGRIAGEGDDTFRALLAQVESIEPHHLGATALRTRAVDELRARADGEATLGQLDAAIVDYRNLLALEPDDLDAPLSLAEVLVLRARGKPPLPREALVALLVEAVPLADDDLALHRVIADLLLANDEPERAAAEYERARELAPEDEAVQKGLEKATRRAQKR